MQIDPRQWHLFVTVTSIPFPNFYWITNRRIIVSWRKSQRSCCYCVSNVREAPSQHVPSFLQKAHPSVVHFSFIPDRRLCRNQLRCRLATELATALFRTQAGKQAGALHDLRSPITIGLMPRWCAERGAGLLSQPSVSPIRSHIAIWESRTSCDCS
jgi:hypothetical protein